MQQTIVTAPGSLGDVNPMLAIARALQNDGRRVLFLAAERYLPLAERAGVPCQALVTEEQFGKLASNPQLWHPRHGARLIFREAVEQFLEKHYHWLEENCVPGKTVLVSHMLDFAGRIYRDRHPQTHFVSVLPAPALLRSHTAPPRLSSYFWERWIPRQAVPLLYRAADAWLDRVGAEPINRLRKSLGLPPVKRLLDRWWWSPERVLCLFPEWFSLPAEDLLPQMELIGFPLADSGDVVAPEVSQELHTILQGFGNQRPIVFAPGTAHHHARSFLESACRACQQLQRPGVLISSDPSQFPSQLPPGMVAARYLPFSQLLPRAAAIVHHGGVGTTSQALAAGVPQVVLPMAFDQFDNAERVAKLGCGSWMAMRSQTSQRLAEHVRRLPITATQVQQIAARFPQQPQPMTRAVQLIPLTPKPRSTPRRS